MSDGFLPRVLGREPRRRTGEASSEAEGETETSGSERSDASMGPPRLRLSSGPQRRLKEGDTERAAEGRLGKGSSTSWSGFTT